MQTIEPLGSSAVAATAIGAVTLAVVVGIAWISGVIAALRPSQRAARLDILRAIASH